jgi:hypothetical protein
VPAGHPEPAVPAIDEAHVGTGNDAELGGVLVHRGVRPGVLPWQTPARVPGQQVCPPCSDMGEFGEARGCGESSSHTADDLPDTAIASTMPGNVVVEMFSVPALGATTSSWPWCRRCHRR